MQSVRSSFAPCWLPLLQRRRISNLDAIILLLRRRSVPLVGAKSFRTMSPSCCSAHTCLGHGKDQTRIFPLYVAYNVSASPKAPWFRWFQNGSPVDVNRMLSGDVSTMHL